MELTTDQLPVLTIAIFFVAFLYSSVGHAGASGYIAVMSLFGLSPLVIKPIALALNILVASIASFQFWRSGHFSWRLFWPFALFAIPFAFLGGYINLPTQIFKVIVGVILLFSAVRFLYPSKVESVIKEPTRLIALSSGAGLGFLAGLTGTGGGIFLSPLILFLGWSSTKTTSGITALFILINSSCGLLGNYSSVQNLPDQLPLFIGATLLGALAGTTLGIKFYTANTIKKTLALVLVIAGFKLLLT